jgi:hypothetical protein
MKNKRFLVVLISLMLVCGFVMVGCDNGTTNDETKDKDSNTGVNELAEKTYVLKNEKWVFDVDKTYHYFINFEDSDDDPIWVEEANGNYSWNTGSKTVTLSPKKCLGDDDTLLDRTEYLAEMKKEYADSTDDDAKNWSDGKYKTIQEYINGMVNEAFDQQTYNYVLEDNKIIHLIK